MKSIFTHKQYDRMDSGSYSPRVTPTFKKELYDLEWIVYPIKHDFESIDYHIREFNLKLLEDIVDVDNYYFDYYIITEDSFMWTFMYRENKLNLNYKLIKLDADTIIDGTLDISFEEACEYIKQGKYEEMQLAYSKIK